MKNENVVGERADCAVRSLACACKVSYSAAYAALEASGRKAGAATSHATLKDAARLLGYQLSERYLRGRYTLQDVQFKLLLSGDYILFVTRHFVGYTGGGVDPADWSYGSGMKIRKVYKVVPSRRVVKKNNS